MTRITGFALLVTLSGLFGAPVAASSAITPIVTEYRSPNQFTSSGVNEQLKICRDNANTVQRSVDLMLLLDNSRSLNLSENPSDPNRIRFNAIEQMLVAVGGAVDGAKVPIEVRLGVVVFNDRVEELIPLASNRMVSADSAKELSAEVEQALPNTSQRAGTNYLLALEEAFTVFDQSSSRDRCRVLVWLTDGEFSNGKTVAATNDDLPRLKEDTCKQNGFAQRARSAQSRIWPFVVLLDPPKVPDNPSAAQVINESYDLMERLTGAVVPMRDQLQPAACPNVPTGRIGNIYGASTAGKLGPIFEELGAEIAGGVLLDACPAPAKKDEASKPRYESIELPAPRHLEWISMVSLGGETKPRLDQFKVLHENGADDVLSHFSFRSMSETSLYLDAIQTSRLDQGWKLEISGSSLEGFCLRAKFVDAASIRVTRKGANVPEFAWDEGSENFTQADLEDVKFYLSNEIVEREDLAQISKADAAGLTARLMVDPSGKLLAEGLPVRVTGFATLPSFDPQSCAVIRIPGSDASGRGDTPETKSFESSGCEVDLRNVTAEVIVDVDGALAALRKIPGCESVTLAPMVNDNEQSRFSGNDTFIVSLRLRFEGNSLKCQTSGLSETASGSVTSALVKFSYVTTPGTSPTPIKFGEASLSVDIDVKAPPPWWLVWFITIGVSAIAVLISIAVLWLMNYLLVRLPDARKFYVLKTPITVSKRDVMSPEYHLQALQTKDARFGSNEFEPIRGNPNRRKWSAKNNFVLECQLSNPLLRPLDEPKAVLAGSATNDSVVVYGPQFSTHGLRLPFQRAVVIVVGQPKSADEPLSGHVFCVVPIRHDVEPTEAVRLLLSPDQLRPLVRELVRSDLLRTAAPLKTREDGGNPTTPPGPTPPGPTPPRRLLPREPKSK
jgi:hypothetical protein